MNCTNCGHTIQENQIFCGQCGQPTDGENSANSNRPQNVTETQASGVSEEELSLFVGKRADIYLHKWKRNSHWNWAAFWFDAYWLLYRKMYLYFFLYLTIVYLAIRLIGSIFLNITGSTEDAFILGLILYGGFKIVVGATGNHLYWRQAQHKINRIVQHADNVPSRSQERQIAEAGGVNLTLSLLLFLLPALIACASFLFYFYSTYRAVSDSLSQQTLDQRHAVIEQEQDASASPSAVNSSPSTSTTSENQWVSVASDINGDNWNDNVGYDRLVVIIAGIMQEWEQENMQLDGANIDAKQDAPAVALLVTTLYEDDNYRHMSLDQLMDVIKEQLTQGTDPLKTNLTNLNVELYNAVENDNYDDVVMLLNKGADPTKSASILAAVRNKNTEMIQLLVQHGADPDYFFSGSTPLSILVDENEVGLTKLLLDLGANPEMGSPIASPLRAAVELGLTDMVKLLLSYGADINGFSISDKSMLQVAEESGFTEIYQLLKEQEEQASN